MASKNRTDFHAAMGAGMTPAEKEEEKTYIENSIGGLVDKLTKTADIITLTVLLDWLERQDGAGFDYEVDKVRSRIEEIERSMNV